MTSRNPWLVAWRCFPIKNIVQNAVNSVDHATLVAAIKAGGLVEPLENGFTTGAQRRHPWSPAV
jgi:hypothetical protein